MKHFTYHLLIRSSLSLAALIPVTVVAQNLTFVPRIQTGIMAYEFEKKPVVHSGATGLEKESGYKLSSPMPLMSGGITAFLNSFFIDVYLQKAFSGSDRTTHTLDYNDEPEPRVEVIDSKFDREEYAISMGYAIGKQWAVFGGYRKSSTSFSSLEANEKRFLDKDGDLTYTFAIRTQTDTDFKQDGFFLGATYAFPITEQSAITLNAALGALDGKHNSSSALNLSTIYPDGHEKIRPRSSDFSSQFDGDTVGLNLGIKWKGFIDNNLGYSVGLNGYSYKFDGTTLGQNAEEEPIKVGQTLAETVLRLSAGLTYEF